MQPTTTGVHISKVNLTDHPEHLGEEAEQHQTRPSRSLKSSKGAVTLSSRYARRSSPVSISFKTVYRGNNCSFLPVLAGNYKRPLDIRNFLGSQNRIRRFSMSGVPALTRDSRRARAHKPRVLALQQKQAIHKVFHLGGPDHFTSPLFTVPQKGGSYRSVVNPNGLNHFVEYQHFKIEGVPMLKNLLKSKDFLTKIDLKDAYLTVPIWTLCGSLRAFPLGWAVHLGFLQNL